MNPPTPGTVREVFLVFLQLGLTSFGGPIAHLGFFQQELVSRRQWLSQAAYADLVALCQFLPGPASSQVGFALGYLRAGPLGALAACLAFTAPSALFMIALGFGLLHLAPDPVWLHGLKLATLAVVAQAVWTMAQSLCPDRPRATLACLAAAGLLLSGQVWSHVAVILGGMLLGRFTLRSPEPTPSAPNRSTWARLPSLPWAKIYLVLFALGLLGLPLLAKLWPNLWLEATAGFFRAGALVFGGGHVVLPLLEAETVRTGWLQPNEFLAGYGAAQALPGPLFTLAAFLGTVIGRDGPAVLLGMICLTAILLPGFLLVLAALPYWAQLRQLPKARAALAGANAAVVGLLMASLYQPVFTQAVRSPPDLVLALIAFSALHHWKVPPWLVVLICAAAAPFLPGPT